MAEFQRKPNVFERILLVIGIGLIVVGYIAIHKTAFAEGSVSWDLLQTTFLWILMILLVILAAVNENMKEELRTVIQNQIEEMKLLRADFKKKK